MFTLNDLISELKLSNKKLDELKFLINKYNSDDWKDYEHFSEIGYRKNLVFRNELYEIFVICWNNKQFSVIHNHPENGCLLKVLDGELSEYKYNTETLELIESNNYTVGSSDYIDDNLGYHKVGNDSKKKRAVSLHIYSPPKFVAQIFEI